MILWRIMVFSSLIFTFYFLPIVLLLYYLSKESYRNYILLAASIFFYAYGEPKFIFVMAVSIAVNYGIALLIDHNRQLAKGLLIIDVIFNIGILFFYKYLDFGIVLANRLFCTDFHLFNLLLPIGISFYTFQALSYVIDVYRGTVKVQKNPLFVALYISFFPQLIAGPIVRYHDIEKQLFSRRSDVNLFGEGVKRFLIGFCKKVILANNLAVVAEEVFGMQFTTVNPLVLWLGSICYSLQIFYDFSGYSDMAIGLGKMFGFTFTENFNYPYISRTVTEFWRRWHISLSFWFRDYVYIPLGGSRGSIVKNIQNMLVVWLLTGLWHGANFTFIFWGLGYFVLLVFEKYLLKPTEKKSRILQFFWRIVTLFCVNWGWVIFNSPSLKSGLRYCLSMLGVYVHRFTWDSVMQSYMREYGIYLLLGMIFSTPMMKVLETKIGNSRAASFYNIFQPVIYAAVFLWAVSFLILGAHNPFIYFNF